MTARFSRVAMLRAGVLGALGGVALFAACDTQMPTAAEIEALDVASAEAQANRFRFPMASAETRYFVDGKEVTAEEAHAIAADHVVTMTFTQEPSPNGLVRVFINTRSGQQAQQLAQPRSGAGEANSADTPKAGRVYIYPHSPSERMPIRAGAPNEPLIIIDGRPAQPADLYALQRDQIAQIEVLKGDAARRFLDPRATNGVIVLTTRAGSAPR